MTRDKVHWKMPLSEATVPQSACGLESWTLPCTQEFTEITCHQCLAKLEEVHEFK